MNGRPFTKGIEDRPVGGMERHLRAPHKSVDLQVRKALVSYASRLQLVELNQVNCPDARSLPVEGLSIVDRWVCDSCGYARASEENMEKHSQRAHKWIKANGRQWQSRTVYTNVFQSDECKYFVYVVTSL
jgi:hypothetical protein